MIRVLVVEEQAERRAALVARLRRDPHLEVVGQAAPGGEVLRMAGRLHPDVIALGLHRGEADVLPLIHQIMRELPLPLVAVTAADEGQREGLEAAALAAGVLAVVALSDGEAGADGELGRVLANMAPVRVIRRWAAGKMRHVAVPARPHQAAPRPDVVAIGSSTGGPEVLQHILTRLPEGFRVPVLIVQHISPGFAPSMVDWLAPQCAVPMQVAETGMPLGTPGIYVAPTGRHLTVAGRVIRLTDDPPVSGHRPSATVLFRSVAREYGPTAMGVLLTGMGEDGAVGLYELKRAGGVTIAQDEASSVVFGMAAVAISRGIVDHVLPPAGIAALLVELVRSERGGEG